MQKIDLWLVFSGDRLLVTAGSDNIISPLTKAPEEFGLTASFVMEVGELNGSRCFTADVGREADAPEGTSFRALRRLLGDIDDSLFAVAGRAKQIVDWNHNHRFCGRCGTGTGPGPTELSKKCPNCGMVFYPRLSPAAIMLVTRGDEALLARSSHFPPGMYSALAGFVEPGESVEQTVAREVKEEVGLEVRNPRYFGSQSWPFPDSLMIGFTAEYADGELRFEPEEIEDAGWFHVEALPDLPPRLSIARALIDDFVENTLRSSTPKV